MVGKLPVQLAYRLGLLGRWLAVQDPVRLCKRLRLEGYEHLVAADEAPERLVIQLDENGPWQVALWVIAYYRGPVALADDVASRGGLGVLAGELVAASASRRVVWAGGSTESRLRARARLEDGRLRVIFNE